MVKIKIKAYNPITIYNCIFIIFFLFSFYLYVKGYIIFIMSGNYAQLTAAALAYKTAEDLVHEKEVEKSTADQELIQSTAALNEIDKEVDTRTLQYESIIADHDAAVTEKATLLTKYNTLVAQKILAVTGTRAARIAISNKSVPGQPAAPETAGTLFDAKQDVTAAETDVNAIADPVTGTRKTALDAVESQRLAIWTRHNQLDGELLDLDAANRNLANVIATNSHPSVIVDATGVVAAKQLLVDTSKTAITNLETAPSGLADLLQAYNAIVTDLDAKMRILRTAEDKVASLENDYVIAYNAWLVNNNQLEDIVGVHPSDSDQTNAFPLAYPGVVAASTSSLLQNRIEKLNDMKPLAENLKTRAIEGQTLRQSTFDTDKAKSTVADNALKSATVDWNAKRVALVKYIEIQVGLEVSAAALLLEEFLKNYDMRVASSPHNSTDVIGAVALTCPGSNVHELLSRINVSYSTESAYLALCEILTEMPVESFFDKVMDECFRVISEEYAESTMNDIRTQFGKKSKELISKYGKCGKSASSSGMAWWWWVIIVVVILIVLAVVLAVVFGAGPLTKYVRARTGTRKLYDSM
jgi:hypothetical protein